MNADVKKQWTAALLSGEYEQGTGFLVSLNDSPRFCCLGVLCDLAEQSGVVSSENYRTRSVFRDQNGLNVKVYGKDGAGDPEYLVLPPVVQEWAGLDHGNPAIEGQSLSNYNDSGKTFAEIAALIDEHL